MREYIIVPARAESIVVEIGLHAFEICLGKIYRDFSLDSSASV